MVIKFGNHQIPPDLYKVTGIFPKFFDNNTMVALRFFAPSLCALPEIFIKQLVLNGITTYDLFICRTTYDLQFLYPNYTQTPVFYTFYPVFYTFLYPFIPFYTLK